MANRLVLVVLASVLLITVVRYVVLGNTMIAVLVVEAAEEAAAEAAAGAEAVQGAGAEATHVVTAHGVLEAVQGAGADLEAAAGVVLVDTADGIVNMEEVTDVVQMAS